MIELKSKSHFSNTGENLAKAGVFDGLNIHEHKDVTIL